MGTCVIMVYLRFCRQNQWLKYDIIIHLYLPRVHLFTLQEQAAAKAPVVEAVKYALMKGWTLSQVKCSELQNLPLKKKLVCMMKPRVKKDKDKKKGKKEEKKKGEDKKREKEGKVTEMEDGTIYYEPKSVYDLSKVGMRINLLVSHTYSDSIDSIIYSMHQNVPNTHLLSFHAVPS